MDNAVRAAALRAPADDSEREGGYYMCGIVGFVGAEDAAPILLDSLERLEYRGYDSAGIAVVDRESSTLITSRNAVIFFQCFIVISSRFQEIAVGG